MRNLYLSFIKYKNRKMNSNIDYLNDSYQIINKIGSGGGSSVYKAYHRRLKKYVVIKKIENSTLQDVRNRRMEADILKNLSHKYLPQIYDFIDDGSIVYTVMEYIDGRSFKEELIARRRFPQKKVIEWAIQLCDALNYLHTRNTPIIHGDIKPSNIMLRANNNICLIDFNISMLSGIADGIVGYTWGYSPPEMISLYRKRGRLTLNDNNYTEISTEKLEQTVSVACCDKNTETILIDEYLNRNNHESDYIPKEKLSTHSKLSVENRLSIENRLSKENKLSVKNSLNNDYELSLLNCNNDYDKNPFLQLDCGKPEVKKQNSLDNKFIIDARTDIYSLGVTMLQLLTGEMLTNYTDSKELLNSFYFNINKGVKKILIKCTSYDREERYATASELKDELNRVISKI